MAAAMNASLSNRQRISFWTVFSGYLGGCGVTGLLLGLFLVVTSPNADFTSLDVLVFAVLVPPFLAIVTCFIAWPGFIVLRFLLWVTGRTDWPSFAVAGVLNAVVMAMFLFGSADIELFLKYPPDPIFLPIGFAAGVAACLAERHFAGRVMLEASSP